MEKADFRIEIYYRYHDARGLVTRKKLKSLGYAVESVMYTDNYLISADIDMESADKIAHSLIQPVTQAFLVNSPYEPDFDYAVEIGFLPGVTDNVAHTVRETANDLLNIELDIEKSVFSSYTCFLKGDITKSDAEKIASEFYNPLIERVNILSKEEYNQLGGMGYNLPVVTIKGSPLADEVNISCDDTELMKIAKEGISNSDGSRRGPLALDMASMQAIKDYFIEKEKRQPRDIELESIAQTWSEHCKHTIFASKIDDVEDGIYRRYIKEATKRIRKEKGEKDFCMSVFTDNSGGIEFNEDYIISDKVETHNSPSALDPFGGAITGIVGVNRDAIGFGMAAKPVANRYGFCFADPADTRPLYRGKDKGTKLLSPERIMKGVIHGVNAGGNTSGIPTPQGFVYFDERYRGKPLVFVGTIGLMPKELNGKPSVTKSARDGDYIVMTGGRVGRDGIHGATFSSEALDSGSPATAVQIGDPITQKKMSDAIVKEARDLGLYNSITDNGAGGLSCSVAEMARECGGFEVDLEKVPLKYPGLSPWQIWISESQERMTLSVSKNNLDKFLDLMKRRGVEATVIGKFNSTDRGIVKFNGNVIFDLDMNFLHEGLPDKILYTKPVSVKNIKADIPEQQELTDTFIKMTGRLNTASFDFISYQYDYEVQGNSVIKPVQGKGKVNSNASVIRPLLDSMRGVVLSQGLYPSYSEMDPYRMAACSIDTAIRNAVAAGGSVDYMALLDNFCWCDSNNSERLWQLKQAAEACYDFAVAYGTPFISGKDSMFNDFRGYDADLEPVTISIPPTLLISSIGVVEDIHDCQTMDFKKAGDLIYILGETADEIGGSEYLSLIEDAAGKKSMAGNIPEVKPELFIRMYRQFEIAMKEGFVASSLSVERGGLGYALARSSMAGMLGFSLDVSLLPGAGSLRNDIALFSESQGRLLVTINPKNREKFEELFSALPLACAGTVREDDAVIINSADCGRIVNTRIGSLLEVYKNRFADF